MLDIHRQITKNGRQRGLDGLKLCGPLAVIRNDAHIPRHLFTSLFTKAGCAMRVRPAVTSNGSSYLVQDFPAAAVVLLGRDQPLLMQAAQSFQALLGGFRGRRRLRRYGGGWRRSWSW